MNDIRGKIKSYRQATTLELLRKLNPKIRGWANYFKHVVAKKTFDYVDYCIFRAIWRWVKRRHPTKRVWWLKKKYFLFLGTRNWIFTAKFHRHTGKWKTFELFKASSIPIERHIKIKAEANPFDTKFKEYFERRKYFKRSSLSIT